MIIQLLLYCTSAKGVVQMKLLLDLLYIDLCTTHDSTRPIKNPAQYDCGEDFKLLSRSL